MQLRSIFALALFAASLSLAYAKDSAPAVQADPETFPGLRDEIDDALKSDDYSELTRSQREEITAALNRMERTLSTVTSVQELSDNKKSQLFNDQELVNTVLTKAAADSRTICRKEVRLGSHRANQKCRTVGEIRREREQAQREMRKIQVPKMRGPGGP